VEIEKTESTPIRRWLRTTVLNRSIELIAAGTFFCTLGLIIIFFTSAVAAFVSLMLLLRVSAAFFLAGTKLHIVRPSLLLGSVAFIVAFSFWEAWRSPYGLGSFQKAVHVQDRVSGAMLGAFGSIIGDLFLAGPRMTLSGIDSLFECGQLLRMNSDDAAAVLLWMLKRNHKVAVEELVSVFPQVNFIRLLPQLRLLKGFIWLLTKNGVCILSSELKAELRGLLRIEFQSSDEPETSVPRYEVPLSEEQQWFAMLGLEAYASLAKVKKRYRLLARQFHPDRHRTDDLAAQNAAEERMKAINDAYQNICRRFAEA